MRIKGNEFDNLSDEEKAEAIQRYIETFSQDDSFLEFAIFGKKAIRQMIATEGSKGVKVVSSLQLNDETGKMQLYPILIPVNKHGQELDFTFVPNQGEEGEVQIMDDPNPPIVRCPNSCN